MYLCAAPWSFFSGCHAHPRSCSHPQARYFIDDVVSCSRLPDRRDPNFQFVVLDVNEFKTFEFAAKADEEAEEIVDKVNSLLKSRISDRRNQVVQRYEQRLVASKKK
jgi:hypothetical protein